jgi:hypothetical protein
VAEDFKRLQLPGAFGCGDVVVSVQETSSTIAGSTKTTNGDILPEFVLVGDLWALKILQFKCYRDFPDQTTYFDNNIFLVSIRLPVSRR